MHPASAAIDASAVPAAAQPADFAIPQELDEEYSHPISVPTAAPNYGPGGTMSLNLDAIQRHSLANHDHDADPTAVLDADDIARARAASPVSGQIKSAQAGAQGTAQVGRYQVLLRLARGGMGTVYLCRVTGEGGFRRLFALKVIREHHNRNQAYVQMLLEEARIASRLNHPNVVPIIDIDVFAGQHFLVMDYVEGCTLSELLKAHAQSRPPELIIPIIIDALTGVHAAHTMRGDDGTIQPLVHCDFSPQNMLVGVNGTCRLIDFGVAKASDTLLQGSDRGKPGYLSPEQVRGQPVDARSDVFAAGVVLWNALTGEQLFEGDTPEQVLHQVITAKIPKPSSVGLRPPACFDRICLKALERDPQRRYQSAEQMLVELRKVAIADDWVAPSSMIGQWVFDTFGAQIERRRVAAGLGPELAPPAHDIGPSGHSDGPPREASATGIDLNASQTMMLRASPSARAEQEDEEGMGARAKVVVLVAALAFMLAAAVTLFVRPDLLQGGMLDEDGQYMEIPSLSAGEDDGGQGPALVAEGTSGETDGTDEGGTDDTDGGSSSGTEGTDETDTDETEGEEPEPADDGKKKSGKGKTKTKTKTKKGKTKKGKTKPDDDEPKPDKGEPKPDKGKSDGGTDEPPVDLDELFRRPGDR